MEELLAKVTALESENKSLKEVIEQLDAQCKAFDHTLTETFKANNSLKTEFLLLQNKEQRLLGEVKALNVIIEEMKADHLEKYAETL